MIIKHAVLFVCSGNTCRSPAAACLLAGCLKQKGEDPQTWLIDSAGLRAGRGQPATARMAAALVRRGQDLSRHRSRPVEDVEMSLYQLVLVMEPEQQRDLLARYPSLSGKVFLLGDMNGSGGEVEDPFGMDDQAYEQTARQIEGLIKEGFARIARLSGG